MMGRYTPPARAVVLGLAGARSASESTSPYERLSVLLPRSLIKVLATRSERPVLTKLRAKKKARTMSQMTSLVKAWKAAWKGRMPEATVKVRQKSAQAPEVTPAGWGHKNHSATAGATDAASGTSG